MEEEDFKIIEYKNRTFKCFRDGRCFILSFNKWRECLAKNKSHNVSYYRIHIGRNVKIAVHRIIAYCFLGLDINDKSSLIDHINGNGLDNSFGNLRIVDNQTNCKNKFVVKGVYKHPCGRYIAQIYENKKQIRKGFKTKQEALEWRRQKEIELGYLTKSLGI